MGAIDAIHYLLEFHGQEVEEQGFTADVLTELLNVPELGLGVTTEDVTKAVAPTAARDFIKVFAGAGAPLPFGLPGHLLARGLLWNDAEELALAARKLKSERKSLGSQFMHLQVYELSYCKQSSPDCGPGYSDGVNRHHGIEPVLYFEFMGEHEPSPQVFSRKFVTPYMADAWMRIAPKAGVFSRR